jgi:hypothetical protein
MTQADHQSWLDLVDEEIIEPELAIIDPHHHLWVRDGEPYLMPELLDDVNAGHNIVATVYAECHSMYRAEGPEELRSLGETEFVTGVAAMSASGGFGDARLCEKMFGRVDLGIDSRTAPQRFIEPFSRGALFNRLGPE